MTLLDSSWKAVVKKFPFPVHIKRCYLYGVSRRLRNASQSVDNIPLQVRGLAVGCVEMQTFPAKCTSYSQHTLLRDPTNLRYGFSGMPTTLLSYFSAQNGRAPRWAPSVTLSLTLGFCSYINRHGKNWREFYVRQAFWGCFLIHSSSS